MFGNRAVRKMCSIGQAVDFSDQFFLCEPKAIASI
jgi:hypothetical protein